MKPHQIESWTLGIIERIEKGQPIEDSRIELKSEWPEPASAARRIAGHANAAHGNKILWLIGVDEKKGAVGVNYQDFAQWLKQVTSFFSEMSPRADIYNIPASGKTIAAVLFETDRAPYVVKNPNYGKQYGGPIEREVPWREGTFVRSATRADLLIMLSPLQMLPSFEVLSGYIEFQKTKKGDQVYYFGRLHLSLYVEVLHEERIIIPFHRCSSEMVFIDSGNRLSLSDLLMRPPILFGGVGRSSIKDSLTIDNTRDELIIIGSGKVSLQADLRTHENPEFFGSAAEVRIILNPIGSKQNLSVIAEMNRSDIKDANQKIKWVTRKTGE